MKSHKRHITVFYSNQTNAAGPVKNKFERTNAAFGLNFNQLDLKRHV